MGVKRGDEFQREYVCMSVCVCVCVCVQVSANVASAVLHGGDQTGGVGEWAGLVRGDVRGVKNGSDPGYWLNTAAPFQLLPAVITRTH